MSYTETEIHKDWSTHGVEYTRSGIHTEWDTHGIGSEVDMDSGTYGVG